MTPVFKKGEYDYDFPTGHVHVSVPRDIMPDEIDKAWGGLVLEAYQRSLDNLDFETVKGMRTQQTTQNQIVLSS